MPPDARIEPGRTRRCEAADVPALLRQTDLFSSVDQHILEALAARCEIIDAPAGTTLMKQGEVGAFAYLIIEGNADILAEFASGAIRVSQAGPLELIGEIGAICNCPRSATVVAHDDVRVLHFSKEVLDGVIRDFPQLAFAMVQKLGERLHNVNLPLARLTWAANALEDDARSAVSIEEVLRTGAESGPLAATIARLANQIALNRAQRYEMDIAARIQRSILPKAIAWQGAGPFAEIAASMRPARDVGGDFYDYFLLDQHRLALVIADVSGKGVPAALFMALSRNALRAVARVARSPADCLAQVNALLCDGNDAMMFVTMVYGILDAASGELVYAAAGHDMPLVQRADGRLEELEPTRNVALGVQDQLAFVERATVLQPGEVLFLYTDGITEAQDAAGALFSYERLHAQIAALPPGSAQRLVAGVNAAVDTFAAGCPQADDITCLAVRYTGTNASAPPTADPR